MQGGSLVNYARSYGRFDVIFESRSQKKQY